MVEYISASRVRRQVLIKLKNWGSLASGGLALESPDVEMVMLFI